jgi:hypothetical protein
MVAVKGFETSNYQQVISVILKSCMPSFIAYRMLRMAFSYWSSEILRWELGESVSSERSGLTSFSAREAMYIFSRAPIATIAVGLPGHDRFAIPSEKLVRCISVLGES